MNKPCPIKQCHANIQRCHQSHCLYRFYQEKSEFDKYDIMYATGLNEKKYREEYSIAKTVVYQTAALFNIVSRLRDNDHHMHCQKCGVLRSTKGECLNQTECLKRVCLGENFIKHSRLRFPEFKSSKNDVFLVLENKEKIQEFMVNSGSPGYWYDLLGIKQETGERYNLVRSLV